MQPLKESPAVPPARSTRTSATHSKTSTSASAPPADTPHSPPEPPTASPRPSPPHSNQALPPPIAAPLDAETAAPQAAALIRSHTHPSTDASRQQPPQSHHTEPNRTIVLRRSKTGEPKTPMLQQAQAAHKGSRRSVQSHMDPSASTKSLQSASSATLSAASPRQISLRATHSIVPPA